MSYDCSISRVWVAGWIGCTAKEAKGPSYLLNNVIVLATSSMFPICAFIRNMPTNQICQKCCA